MRRMHPNFSRMTNKKALTGGWSGIHFILPVLILFLGSCTILEEPVTEEPRDLQEELRDLPEVPREFRAVWIASVANIDWPSERGLSSGEQKSELRSLLDKAHMLNLNAVILQVRPAADAFYQSEREPWSEYLSGEMGKDPGYDPLEFAVEEAHRRGMELHAWMNPFRALHSGSDSLITEDHISRRHPEMVVEYGNQLWMDPGLEEAREYNINVALDIVEHYDIDGIHLDDYFYPYPVQDESGGIIEFPDTATWNFAQRELADDEMNRDDWRRENINTFVRDLYESIRETDEKIRLGISPFGIWRPGYPEQIDGTDAYNEIYADSRKWLNEGWLDYFTPQLYWAMDQYEQSYTALLEWWNSENPYGRHIWPGNFISRVGVTRDTIWEASEIVDQIRATRNIHPSEGNVLFSMQALVHNHDQLADMLVEEVYSEKALVPHTPWLDHNVPLRPEAYLEVYRDEKVINLTSCDEHDWLWIIRIKTGNGWHLETVPGWKHQYLVDDAIRDEDIEVIVVNAVSRTGIKSPNAVIKPEN